MSQPNTATDAKDRGRFSAKRKTEAVLRLLRGEDPDTNGINFGPTLPAATSSAPPRAAGSAMEMASAVS